MLSEKHKSPDTRIILVVLLYYLSAELAYFFSFDFNQELPFWPPAGLALAMVVLFGNRVWPGISIGMLIIAIKSYWFHSIDSVQMQMAVVSLVAAGTTLEALSGNLLIKKMINKVYPFSKTIFAFYFLFITLFISFISSGATVVAMYFTNIIEAETTLIQLLTLWVRNIVGILLISPLILSLYKIKLQQPSKAKIIETLVFVSSALLILWIFSIASLRTVAPFALAFISIPFLLWLAFRFKGSIAISGYFSVSLIAIYLTSKAQGPFYNLEFISDSTLLLQLYIIVISISTLILSASIHERQQIQKELKIFNENLESIVQERTKALKEEIQNRKEILKNVELTNEELKKRNTELDNFVYSVSHDLRAPIASILGLINLAKNDKNVKETKRYIELIEKSARQQDYFIREILDQSRNSRLELKSEPLEFEQLIAETFEQLDFPNTSGVKVQKVINVAQDGPFYCDKWRLKVILNNIISNSIRYKNGKDPLIKIDANINSHKLFFSISDNGKGIRKEHISNLGKMFYRATDEGAGSGLGLYIVKEAVQKLHGSLAIESIEGNGTTVSFEIPEVAPG